ncbi:MULTISPECIES: YigZ family protein [Arthrobacter]|uniref:YigZ family protein n=2 Tax=Arthrobacter TaxID=1663 RepID=A0ABU9KKP8_9MICC|nr:YigZ family protein [Arthrobacter sp. YJM1]MDP5226122.1 YigZ family protein [Arthrobacter sp. YJM1]
MPPADESRATRYTTLTAGPDFRNEIEIKRSRFITVLRRVEDEAAARELVSELRREFHDARHHCSAFILGADRMTQRSSDDGEPSGTAGIPMLEALSRRETAPGVTDLSDVCAVVVRYFGGILLGAGGLVRAYSDSVSQAVDAAPLVTRQRLRLGEIASGFATAGKLENELRTAGVHVTGTEYGASEARIRVAFQDDAESLAGVRQTVQSLSAGACDVVVGATEWVDLSRIF